MAKIISVNFKKDSIITGDDIRRLTPTMLTPATEEIEDEIAVDHRSEPIKDINDIYKISEYLIGKGRYRDNMLFIVGINFGLRVSDLIRLRFSNLINDDLTFKTTFPILELKTRNTRKNKRNRYITINDAVMDAVTLYLQHSPSSLSDYMFRSESNRGSNENKPINRKSVDRILKSIAYELNIDVRMSTHTLRKTFAYHHMLMANNDPRKLLLLQKMFGHSSMSQTLDYIGITQEEIEEAYKSLNLGQMTPNTLINSMIGENSIA